MGGKYKLLKEILPLFPENIHTFVDLFGGGFNVGVNVEAEHIIYNDICEPVVKFLRCLSGSDIDKIMSEIDKNIENIILQKKIRKDICSLEKIIIVGLNLQ